MVPLRCRKSTAAPAGLAVRGGQLAAGGAMAVEVDQAGQNQGVPREFEVRGALKRPRRQSPGWGPA